jgi:hypothetical protein
MHVDSSLIVAVVTDSIRYYVNTVIMGLIRNLATYFTAAAAWVTVMPFVVRARMDGYVERCGTFKLRQRQNLLAIRVLLISALLCCYFQTGILQPTIP